MAQPIYLDPELQGIERERQLAQALQQRGMKPLEGQVVGNRFIAPSWTQHLANLYDVYSGGQRMAEAEKKSQAYADALRQQSIKDIQDYAQVAKGTPATLPTFNYGNNEADQIATMTSAGTPAVPPNPEKALGILMGSKSPQSQALAQALLADQIKSHIIPEGGTLVRGSLGGGVGQTIQGAPKESTEIRTAAALVGLGNKPPSLWTQEEINMVDRKVTQLNQSKAPSVSVSTGKDLAGQIGDIAKESKISATGAIQSADAANRIIKAVDTNKIFSGAGANQRLTGAQIAEGLGWGGKDTAEKIANTRQAIQGLAQLTLQGRKQMRGEGAITESEGALAERAMSGDISLTKGEIRQLAEAAKRSAKFQYSQHQNIMNTIKADPNARGLAAYYDVPTTMDIFNPTAIGGQSDVRSQADAIIGQGRK